MIYLSLKTKLQLQIEQHGEIINDVFKNVNFSSPILEVVNWPIRKQKNDKSNGPPRLEIQAKMWRFGLPQTKPSCFCLYLRQGCSVCFALKPCTLYIYMFQLYESIYEGFQDDKRYENGYFAIDQYSGRNSTFKVYFTK